MQIILTIDGVIKKIDFKPDTKSWVRQNPPSEFFIWQIDNASYFIKRQLSKFSGWGLLVEAISQNQIRNAPKITSIANHQNRFYYVTEFFIGDTLEKYIKKNKITTQQQRALVDSVSQAVMDINKRGYWYSDLCKKNIFLTESGEFKLIDLDSCFCHSTPFHNSGKVSTEYQGLLSYFAKNHRKISSFNIYSVPPQCINQSELIALAIDCKNKFLMGIEKKTIISHAMLIHQYPDLYNSLFCDLLRGEPNWGATLDLVKQIIE